MLKFQMVYDVKNKDGFEYSFRKSFKTLENAIDRFNGFGSPTTKQIHAKVIDKETKNIVWETVKDF